MLWGICSEPYKLSDLKMHHLTEGGQIVGTVEGDYKVDGIVLMKNTHYYRGAFGGCLKFKNTDMNTLDLQVLSLDPLGSTPGLGGDPQWEAGLGMMSKLDLVKFRTTRLLESELSEFDITVGNIVEFRYDHGTDRLVPFRDRSMKSHPNGRNTVENIWATLMQPVAAEEIYRAVVKPEPEPEPVGTYLPPPPVPVLAKVISVGAGPKKCHRQLLLGSSTGDQEGKRRKVSVPRQILAVEDSKELSRDDFDLQGEGASAGVEKLAEMLGLYLSNFDSYDNGTTSTIEVEFKFGVQTADSRSGSVTGISEEYFGRVLTALTAEFPAECRSRSVTTDVIPANSNMRYTVASADVGGGVVQTKKKKLRFGDGHFQTVFTCGGAVEGGVLIRGTVSHEHTVPVARVPRAEDSPLQRHKDRYSFHQESYRIDLTRVVTTEGGCGGGPTTTFELEVELARLDIQGLQEVLTQHSPGGISEGYVEDLFGCISYLVSLRGDGEEGAMPVVGDASRGGEGRSFNRDFDIQTGSAPGGVVGMYAVVSSAPGAAEVGDNRDHSTRAFGAGKKMLDQLVQAAGCPANIRMNVLRLACGYWKSVFDIDRSSGGVLKGKNKASILGAMVYISMCECGIKQSIVTFGLSIAGSGVSKRELVKGFAVAIKYIQPVSVSQGDCITEMDKVRNQIVNGVKMLVKAYPDSLARYERNMGLLVDVVMSHTNNPCLIQLLGCSNPVGIMCVYVHCITKVRLVELLELCNGTLPKGVRKRCVDQMTQLVEGRLLRGAPVGNELREVGVEMSDLMMSIITANSVRDVCTLNIRKETPGLMSVVSKIKQFSEIERGVISQLIGTTNPAFVPQNSFVSEYNKVKEVLDIGVRILAGVGASFMGGAPERVLFDMLKYLDVYSRIDISELYKNFETDSTFVCIRWKDLTKVYPGITNPPTMKCRKEKIINYTQFQNTIEIFVRLANDHQTCRNISVKLFANGSFTITGCCDFETPTVVSEMIRNKVNCTPGATSKSELSRVICQDIKLDPTFSSHVRYTMVNASARCNVMLVPTVTDPHGLMRLQGMFQKKYNHLLADETNPKIKAHQSPCWVPPPGVKSSKRLILKLKGGVESSVMTVQWHTTGALNFTSTTEGDLVLAYETIRMVIMDEANVDPVTRQILQ